MTVSGIIEPKPPLLMTDTESVGKKTIKQKNGRSLNILYMACHEILEYDEVRMLRAEGHRVFSIGSFINTPMGRLRRPIHNVFQSENKERYAKEGLTKEFLRAFDVVVVMHDPAYVEKIAVLSSNIPIVYRSIGQSNIRTEEYLSKFISQLKVVRYSEFECDLEGFLPHDKIIYFGKYLWDFRQEEGRRYKISTFHNNYKLRNEHSSPSLEEYIRIRNENDFYLYGDGNENLPFTTKMISYNDQLQVYSESSVYFYVYTLGPSYTLSFIEAMAARAPIVAPSKKMLRGRYSQELLNNYSFTSDFRRYQIEDLLGFDDRLLYSSVQEAKDKVDWLTNNPSYRNEVSNYLLKKFQDKFDAEKISKEWTRFLCAVV